LGTHPARLFLGQLVSASLAYLHSIATALGNNCSISSELGRRASHIRLSSRRLKIADSIWRFIMKKFRFLIQTVSKITCARACISEMIDHADPNSYKPPTACLDTASTRLDDPSDFESHDSCTKNASSLTDVCSVARNIHDTRAQPLDVAMRFWFADPSTPR
jgi:hypothetical protein